MPWREGVLAAPLWGRGSSWRGGSQVSPSMPGVSFEIKELPDLTTWQPGKEGCLLCSLSSEPQWLGGTPGEVLEETGGASWPELHLASSLTLSLTLFLSLLPSHSPTLLPAPTPGVGSGRGEHRPSVAGSPSRPMPSPGLAWGSSTLTPTGSHSYYQSISRYIL